MTTQEFLYWLQGYFELSGNAPIPENFNKIVSAHIKLAKYADPNPAAPLAMALNLIETLVENCNYSAIRDVLHNTFYHAIDNSYDVDLDKALEIHSMSEGISSERNKMVMRC